MSEDRYMLMMLASDDRPHGGTFWGAARLDGERALTPEQIEQAAAIIPFRPRFMFPFTEQTERFAASGPKAPTLAMFPGETPWDYGAPTRTDSLSILKAVLDGAESPEPNSALLPVASVVREAIQRLGEADAHDVETHFDEVVLDLGGSRAGEPPAYRVEIDRLLLS
jgi:hypothetical protein